MTNKEVIEEILKLQNEVSELKQEINILKESFGPDIHYHYHYEKQTETKPYAPISPFYPVTYGVNNDPRQQSLKIENDQD